MAKSGFLSSPNFPSRYPSSLDSIQTIRVAEGKGVHLRWIDFETEPRYDYVRIKDEHGTELWPEKLWGSQDGLEMDVDSNIVKIIFHTDGDTTRGGWRLEWTEQ